MRGFSTENKLKQWARFALKAGLLLTDAKLWNSINDQLHDHAEDVADEAQRQYKGAANRVRAAHDALRGDDHGWVGPALSFLGGVGLGVGVGILMAPASGEETRSALRDKAIDIKNNMKRRAGDMSSSTFGTSSSATGTEGY